MDPLCDELRDIAGSLEWTFTDVDDDEKDLRGIILSPASEMEPIVFLFDSKGRIHSIGDLLLSKKSPKNSGTKSANNLQKVGGATSSKQTT